MLLQLKSVNINDLHITPLSHIFSPNAIEIIPNKEYVTELHCNNKMEDVKQQDMFSMNGTIDSGVSANSKYAFDASRSINTINPKLLDSGNPYDNLA